ncbi:hypothetical protein KJ840_00075 [Patescibacteria group bacterium]|nr:hypothetical protein [Patescibacteria group bacterium]
MNKKSSSNAKKIRTARLSVSVAIQEALEVGKILKKLGEIFDTHHETNLSKIKNCKAPSSEINICLSGYELGRINGALRDYITLRIANIVDSHPASLSLKAFDNINLDSISKIPQIKQILDARNNWIGHINPRFIGPVNKDILYSKEVVSLLETLQMLICTGAIKERKK